MPVGYTQGRRVPLLLNVHGGPAGVFQQTFLGSRGVYPLASFAARGYAVLRPNPRGSSGYGVEFRRANIKDRGGMDYQDLMTGVDHVIKLGVADPERLGVMGWSYGGYVTSWVITQNGPQGPRMLLEVMQTSLEWFDKYLRGGTEESRGR